MNKVLPEYLTPQEVADLLKISYETALGFIKYSGIDYVMIGRQYRVSLDKLKDFLDRGGGVVVDLNQ